MTHLVKINFRHVLFILPGSRSLHRPTNPGTISTRRGRKQTYRSDAPGQRIFLNPQLFQLIFRFKDMFPDKIIFSSALLARLTALSSRAINSGKYPCIIPMEQNDIYSRTFQLMLRNQFQTDNLIGSIINRSHTK